MHHTGTIHDRGTIHDSDTGAILALRLVLESLLHKELDPFGVAAS